MKRIFPIGYVCVLAAMPLSALAHDSNMHKPADAAPADCSSMANMDPSTIDMNDPLMKALFEQCKDHLQSGHDANDTPEMHEKPEPPADSGGTY